MNFSESVRSLFQRVREVGEKQSSPRITIALLFSLLIHVALLFLVVQKSPSLVSNERTTLLEKMDVIDFFVYSENEEFRSERVNGKSREVMETRPKNKKQDENRLDVSSNSSTRMHNKSGKKQQSNNELRRKNGDHSGATQSAISKGGDHSRISSTKAKDSSEPIDRRALNRNQSPDSQTGGSLLRMRSTKQRDVGLTTLSIRGSRAEMSETFNQLRSIASNGTSSSNTRDSPKNQNSNLTIEKYKFRKEAENLLTYRDPSDDFIAVLMPNGDLEFETRAPVSAGLCALGICTEVGGIRRRGEKKRKSLNRVRVRFAPIPVGFGMQFGSLRGVEAKKADIVRATFEVRLRLKIAHLRRVQKRALATIETEMLRIKRRMSLEKAREILLARVLEINVDHFKMQQADSRTRKLLGSLNNQGIRGAVRLCQAILEFASRHLVKEPTDRSSEVYLQSMSNHCRKLRAETLR